MPFQDKPLKDFIGSGISFPIQLNQGRAVLSSGFELIRSSIKMILGWPVGSRFYLAEFGSKLEELLEEPNDDILKQIIYTFVVDPITVWEKRVSLVDVSLEDVTSTKLNLRMTYRIVNSQTTDTFVFPFYRNIVY
jgi:phage baseplate assembly protein W